MDLMRSVEDNSGEAVEDGVFLSSRLFLLLISGFVLVFVGIVVILVASVFYGGGSVNGGVVIFIGPFPIVVGAGPDVSVIVLVSVILAVLSVVVFLVMNRKIRRVYD
jgi:uncharacterized membrane protein